MWFMALLDDLEQKILRRPTNFLFANRLSFPNSNPAVTMYIESGKNIVKFIYTFRKLSTQ